MNAIDYDLAEMLETYDDGDFDEAIELFAEDDEFAEDEERRRRGRQPRRVKTAQGGRYYRPRPAAGATKYVTQPQLEAALERVRKDVRSNGEAIKAVNARVNTLNSEQAALSTSVRRETVQRKKDVQALKAELKRARESAILPLLLQKPPQVELTRDGEGDVTDVKIKSSDSFLPLLLLLGGGGLGGEGGSGDNLLLLALAFQGR